MIQRFAARASSITRWFAALSSASSAAQVLERAARLPACV
jgi:hypothetical protein